MITRFIKLPIKVKHNSVIAPKQNLRIAFAYEVSFFRKNRASFHFDCQPKINLLLILKHSIIFTFPLFCKGFFLFILTRLNQITNPCATFTALECSGRLSLRLQYNFAAEQYVFQCNTNTKIVRLICVQYSFEKLCSSIIPKP